MRSACAPCSACQVLRPTTASAASAPPSTPYDGRRTTRSTPGTARAGATSTAPGLPPRAGAWRITANRRPGGRTSRPKRALPSTLAGASTRSTGRPSTRQALRGLGSTSLTGVSAARAASSSKRARGPEGWLTTPSRQRSSATGSRHSSDAAPSSLARAVAAAARSGCQRSATLVEPPVAFRPSSRASLRTTHSPTRAVAVCWPGSRSRGCSGRPPTNIATLP
jgi:hypothetical protein